MARAAKALRLGQSTLSAQLTTLEASLGVQLFDRVRKRLVLTEAGQVALVYAREIFSLGSEMVDSLNDRRDAGLLRAQIGALDSIPKGYVAEIIEFIKEKFGPCRLTLSEGREDDLLLRLKNHQLDLVLLTHQPSVNESITLDAELAGTTTIAVFASPQFSHIKENFPFSLGHVPLVLSPPHCKIRQNFLKFCQKNMIVTDIRVEAQDVGLQLQLVGQGHGVMLSGRRAAGETLSRSGLICLGSIADLQEELWLISTKRRIKNPIVSSCTENFRW